MTVTQQAEHLRRAMDAAALVLTDDQALRSLALYPRWEALCAEGRTVEAGFRFRHGDSLYRTRQAGALFMPQWVPGAGTDSLFERLDILHAGTLQDPIPYAGGMALEEGRYYCQSERVYLCVRATGTAVYHPLEELVGAYVEVAA